MTDCQRWLSLNFFPEAKILKQDINIYINSPGGSITAGMAIYDTMQFIRPDVTTICVDNVHRWARFC